MQLLGPDELPTQALEAVRRLLERDGEDPLNWAVVYAWHNEKMPRAYAVVMKWGEETRAYSVIPDWGAFLAWDVTR